MFYLTKTSKCPKTRYKIWHLIRTNNQSKMVGKRVTKSRTNEEMVFSDGLLIFKSNCEDGEKFTKEEMVFSDGNNKKKIILS